MMGGMDDPRINVLTRTGMGREDAVVALRLLDGGSVGLCAETARLILKEAGHAV